MLRDRRSAPFAAYIKQEQQMPVAEHVARKAGGRKAGMIDVDRQLLGKFADQRLLGRFTGLELAARQLPQPRHRQPFGALLDEQPPIAVDQGRGNADKRCFWRFSGGKRGKIVNLPVRMGTPSGTIFQSGKSEERRVGKVCVSTWRSRCTAFQ